MPHPIDRLLFDRSPVPSEVLARELARPLPKRGDSYWGDAMRELFELVLDDEDAPIAPADLGTQAIALARCIIDDTRSRIEAAPSP